MVTRLRSRIRTMLLVAAAAVLAFASPVQSAYAVTPDPAAAGIGPGNGESVLDLAKRCLRLYIALPKARDGVQGATEAQVRSASEACRRAIEASGLPSTDFWATYRPLIDASATAPVPVPSASLEALVRECVARTARASKAGALNNGVVDDTRAICDRAIEESGLTPDEFWAKYGEKEKPAARLAESSPLFVLNLCVQLAAELTAESTQDQAKLAGEACRKALAAR